MGQGGCVKTLITTFLITHSDFYKQNSYCLKPRQLRLVRGTVLCLMILREILPSIRRTFIYFLGVLLLLIPIDLTTGEAFNIT